MRWIGIVKDDTYLVALVEGEGEGIHIVRRHPIGFDTQTEARRAAARLNTRDHFVTK